MSEEKRKVIHKLRVNVKSLSAEAHIIRAEIKKAGWQYGQELIAHKRDKLKPESRLAQLALAYVRGMPYKRVENKAKKRPSTAKLVRKIDRFTSATVKPADVNAWLDA